VSRQQVIAFRGTVQVWRDAAGPLNLTIVGQPNDGSAETTYLGFAQATELELPPLLDKVAVDRLGAQSYHITASSGEWTLDAKSMHLHRDVTGAFYAVVPPRAAPLIKRVFWRLVLAIAATSLGRALLARR
jgi:hypothetical protein